MLSRRFKTIFVHVPKTAGQSIERVFLKEHGLTWRTRAELLMCRNANPGLGPRRLAHLYAREYVACGHVEAGEYAAYFKFAVVRNPYDRFISEYRFREPRRLRSPERFLAESGDDPFSGRHLAPQIAFVRDGAGATIVDEILRFECLNEDIAPLFRRLFDTPAMLPRTNRSKAPAIDRADLGADLLRSIYKRYEADFDAFGYASGFRR
ncbi:MAG TPA: sulfotransferase family 2 domain-containing protein [Rhizomicrobium sp.]